MRDIRKDICSLKSVFGSTFFKGRLYIYFKNITKGFGVVFPESKGFGDAFPDSKGTGVVFTDLLEVLTS